MPNSLLLNQVTENELFIHQLQNLRQNRFFANKLPQKSYQIFYQTLLKYLNPQTHLDSQNKYLVGTDGCHLCDDAKNILLTAQKTHPFAFTVLDLADADEWLMNEIYTIIPFFITPQKILCYPFGIMDIVFLENY